MIGKKTWRQAGNAGSASTACVQSLVKALSLSLLMLPIAAPTAAAFEAQLVLAGGDEDLADDLKNVSLVFAADRDDVTSPQEIIAAARADYSRLVAELYAVGRYGPVVRILVDGREAATIPPLMRIPRVDQVVIRVEPGPVFRFSEAAIAPLAPNTELPEEFAPGFPAPSGIIGDAASAGVSAWRGYGYAKAGVGEQSIVADHARNALAARIRIAPGPRVTFGNLVLIGESAVRDERLREITALPTGEIYSPDDIEDAAERLRRTGAFRSVVLREAETLGPNNSMNVSLNVVDEKPRRFGFGAEIESTEGLGLSAFWLHRNLLGGAERLRVEGEISGIGGETGGPDYEARTTFRRPATFTPDTDLTLLAEVEQLDEPLFFSRQVNLEAGLNHVFSDTLTASAAIAYRFADVRDGLGERQFQHLTFPLDVTWDRRNDLLNPTGGTYLEAEVMPYVGLDGSASGGRLAADMRAYTGFGGDDRFVLAGRLQLGSIVGSTIAETPPDLLFLSGGGGTVRGQPYQSLAVTTGGARTGGRSFLGLSGELRAGVTEKIQAVAFYDAGYIGPDSWIGDGDNFHAGAGLGIRYQTGIGPIRLDVATPVAGNTGDGVQLYVGIGQAF
jgi:translocation and assembly module TamA